MANDYYKTLGVDKNANAAEIKKAYRKQAMKYHPDHNKDSKDAEAKFKEVNAAYDVLKDDDKRAAYDRSIRLKAGNDNAGANLLNQISQIFWPQKTALRAKRTKTTQ